MEPLFQNAISSIQLGVEDFQSNDERRYISAARNYYAGLLLLAKQCLVNAAPDVDPMDVIGAKFKPILNDEGEVVHEPDGFKTVDFYSLKKRFKDFNLTWPKVSIERLQKTRNNLEHFHLNEPYSAVKEAIAESFPMVTELFNILEKSPATELGDAWQIMLQEREFFEKQLKECENSFNKIEWLVGGIGDFNQIECPECGSCLIEQKDASNTDHQSIEGKCRSCSVDILAEQFISAVLDADFGTLDYVAVKDGAEEIIHDCPECGSYTYVTDEVVGCYWCGYILERECARCYVGLNPNNVAWNNHHLCSYCENLMSKDD